MALLDYDNELLQALLEGDSYGLELIDRVSEITGGAVKIAQGRVYPALRRLEAKGFLESYDGDPLPERGNRPRRYYSLSAEGRRAARGHAVGVGLLRPALGVR